jgi:hypothetical protein
MAIAGASVSPAAYADSGRVQLSVLKGGWVIGGSGGRGMLYFRGRRYPLAIGGMSAGLPTPNTTLVKPRKNARSRARNTSTSIVRSSRSMA